MGLTTSWYARMIHIKSWRIDLPSLRDVLPMFLKTDSQIQRRSHARRVACRHSDVDRRQIVLVQTKGFSRQALDTVAGHGGAESTSRYRQTQSRMTFMIREHRHTEVRVGQPAAALPDRAKFGRLMQTLARLERQPLGQLGVARSPYAGFYGQRRLRPFARRRASNRRPLLVAMRALKPWVRARCKLLGLKVRFIAQLQET
jgi:hypothetical protein